MSKKGNILLSDIQRKKRRRMIAINSLALLGAGILFTLLGFAGKKQSDITCWKVEVKLEGNTGEQFLTEAEVLKLAGSSCDSITGVKVNEIPIQKIHDKLLENKTIREAHVYTSVDGKCVINIQQRRAIARIFNEAGDSFYLDDQGFTFNTSSHYSPRVPVFIGAIPDKVGDGSILDENIPAEVKEKSLLDEIYAFVNFIGNNDFLSAQVEHVHINNRYEFEIIPRVGNHKINMGYVNELEAKYRKLMAFYANTIDNTDLNKYSCIDLRYAGQVVCVKR